VIRLTPSCLEAAAASIDEVKAPESRLNRPQSIRLFENPVLEFASRAHPVTPLIWFLPFLVWGAFHSVGGLGVRSSAGLFLAGWVGFSFFEYVLHRFAFHGLLRGARSHRRQVWGFLVHGYHHHFPNDPMRLVMPPLISWPVAFVFVVGYEFCLGPERAIPAISGTLGGYLALFLVHYYVHHARPASGPGRWLRRYHLRHHHQDAESRYGVTSPVWDVVFGTTGARLARAPVRRGP
jgi:sterol desaturase/sphingolipid hydroxylase (fatty acid hydroxylase superfamily)